MKWEPEIMHWEPKLGRKWRIAVVCTAINDLSEEQITIANHNNWLIPISKLTKEQYEMAMAALADE